MNLILYIAAGAVISLLLNYLADVMPEDRPFSRPTCKKCGHSFTLKEYLFSFRCAECLANPGLRYWLTLILSIVFSVLLAFFPLHHFTYWQSLPLITFLALVLIIDIEHRFVLFTTDVVGIVLGIIYGLLLHPPLQVLFGGLVGAGVMLALFYGGVLFNKIAAKIRKQEIEEVALGLGDVIVCGYLGMIAGIQHVAGLLVLTVLLSGVFALLYVIGKSITRKFNAFSAIPYVPFMVLALIILFYLP
jgi:leader peptidase (prepilin peptidase)/N-methyltransferase